MKLFLGIPIPADITQQLQAMACGLPEANWVPPESHHITLVFLGDMREAEAEDLAMRIASDISLERFDLAVQGTGHFSKGQKTHTLWAGLKESQRLMQLQKRIKRICEESGIKLESRKYAPHITLARPKRAADADIAEWMQQYAGLCYPAFQVDHFCLYESVPASGRRHYRVMASFPLDRPSADLPKP